MFYRSLFYGPVSNGPLFDGLLLPVRVPVIYPLLDSLSVNRVQVTCQCALTIRIIAVGPVLPNLG